MTLDTLLRGVRVARRGYLPFTEPPYPGRYPLGRARQRGALATSNDLVAANLHNVSARRPKSTLYLYEDRRLWHPLGANAFPKSKRQAHPRVVDLTPLRIAPTDPTDPDPFFPFPKRRRLPYRGPLKIPRGHDFFPGESLDKRLNITRSSPVSWEHPYDMIICLKRKIRREVLHALGVPGSHKLRKPLYTQFSFVRCR